LAASLRKGTTALSKGRAGRGLLLAIPRSYGRSALFAVGERHLQAASG
jgi:hypothetical protein